MLRRAPTQTRRWIAVSAASSLPYSLFVDAVASAESPVDEVLKLLPNLASAIDTGLIDTQIHSMLGKISLGIGNSVKVDLTTGGVYDMIAPKPRATSSSRPPRLTKTARRPPPRSRLQ